MSGYTGLSENHKFSDARSENNLCLKASQLLKVSWGELLVVPLGTQEPPRPISYAGMPGRVKRSGVKTGMTPPVRMHVECELAQSALLFDGQRTPAPPEHVFLPQEVAVADNRVHVRGVVGGSHVLRCAFSRQILTQITRDTLAVMDGAGG